MANTKGAHVLNAVKVLRQQRERALELLPPRLHKYLQDRIMASSWYPLDDHVELLRAITTMLSPSGPGDATWQLMGRGTARMDLTGLYKSQLRRGDPEGTMRWMAVMWKNAHDTGEVRVRLVGPGRAEIHLRGFPLRSREICGICTGYIMESVLLSSDREPDVKHVSCCGLGGNECAWTVSWS
jgi:Protein of unknown function (DUF2378)